MSLNLIELLKSSVGDQIGSQASRFLGEKENDVLASLDFILPGILHGLIINANTESSAKNLLALAKDQNDTFSNDPTGLFGGGERTTSLMNNGDAILNMFVGTKMPSLVEAISSGSKLKKGSSSSLLRMIAPLMLGEISRKLTGDKNNVDGLLSLLNSQKEVVRMSAPAGLNSYLGDNDIAGLNQIGSASLRPDAPQVDQKSYWSRFAPLFIGALAILALLWALRSNNETIGKAAGIEIQDPKGVTPKGITDSGSKPTPSDQSQEENNDPKDDTENEYTPQDNEESNDEDVVNDEFQELNSSILEKIKDIPFKVGSVGGRLSKIISQENGIGKSAFFKFLTFEIGSSEIDGKTAFEVDNLAKLLKVVPALHISISGHADGAGDATRNLKISQNRADAVKNRLVNQGISDDRITTKGFGQNEPLTSNNTEEGREQNRRIEVTITKR